MIKDIPTYVIYCEEIGRRPKIEAHLKENGVDAKFWRGIHGTTWGIRSNRPSSYYPDGTPWYMHPGQVSLVINHVMLYQHCLLSGYEHVVILEDDAKLMPDWREKFQHVIDTVPSNYDMVYLGWIEEGNNRTGVPYKGSPFLKHYMNGGCLFGTHALLLSRSGLKKLFETNQIASKHIDIQIWERTIPSMNYLACQPSLVSQMSVTGEMPTSLNT